MKFKINIYHFFLIFFSCILCVGDSAGQRAKPERVLSSDEAKAVKKDASTLFATSDFKGALAGYQELIKTHPENSEFNYRLGICLLQTNFDKASALFYLQKHANSKDVKKDIEYYLGLAHMYNNEWDQAISAFDNYKTQTGGKPIKDMPSADRLIEMSRHGKEICQSPLNITFINPGKIINSTYDDYNPYISADGKYLAFTTRRKGNIGGFIDELGIYTADIYGSVWRDTIWSKAKSFGGLVNGEWDEELVGLNAAGDEAFIYFDNFDFFADIGYTTTKGKSWLKPSMFGEGINTKMFEGSATITLDRSTLYFSGLRKDGIGGSDIWMAKKDPNGNWGSIENLGPEINTKEDDDFPWISMDGNTLYFASKGHNSMGDFDIFKSLRDPETGKWQEAVNVGFPINTADDNHCISFTGDGRFAFIAASRKDGFGNLDIWKVEFNDTSDHPFKTLITGEVVSETGTRIKLSKVTLENVETLSLLTYVPAAAGNSFVLNAVPGKYKVTAEGTNFVTTSKDIIVEDIYPPAELHTEIIVKPSK